MNPFISHSEEDTAKFAADLAGRVEPGTVFALHGTLGAGKSVFSRGFARGLGVTGPIPSPTFTIVQEYQITKEKELARLYHMDLYRISDVNAGLAFGIDEYLDDQSAVTLIEWAERIEGILPKTTVHIKIKHLNEEQREIYTEVTK